MVEQERMTGVEAAALYQDIRNASTTDQEALPFRVIVHGAIQHRCVLPTARQRRKLGLLLGAVVECAYCEQRWQWHNYGDFREWRKVPADG